jgi:hypothetical protein
MTLPEKIFMRSLIVDRKNFHDADIKNFSWWGQKIFFIPHADQKYGFSRTPKTDKNGVQKGVKILGVNFDPSRLNLHIKQGVPRAKILTNFSKFFPPKPTHKSKFSRFFEGQFSYHLSQLLRSGPSKNP